MMACSYDPFRFEVLELDSVEFWITRIGGVVGLVALGVALLGMWRASQRSGGRETGQAQKMLRWSTYLIIGIPYFLVCGLLWKALPLSFPSFWINASTLIIGSVLYFAGLSMYLWAWFTLGRTYNVSSGFGVRLFENHELIRDGPYALVRHPMYVGFQIAAFGGVFLFKTWTFVFLFVNFMFLIIRARREEQALALEYPGQWEKYCEDVPAWFPRLPRRKSG
jgi:protein-S-isoprenylcysteine O-methyltransferase Ste14